MLYGEVESIIGYRFKDISLLETAFTHSSFANDFLGSARNGNERLEFLGDAVLDAVVGLELYRRYPEKDEGFLTKLRAEIVCEGALGSASKALGLNRFLRLGRGEEQKNGRESLAIMADATEAVIAAVFLDGGLDEASKVVMTILGSTIEAAGKGTLPKDFKTELQMLCQKNGQSDIQYKIISEDGPDHAKTFTAIVEVDGRVLGEGTGRSKKLAQAAAAKQALETLEGTGAL